MTKDSGLREAAYETIRGLLEAAGALLPVRLLGAVYTLRPGSLARLELTHDGAAGAHPFKRGTVVIGEVLGGDLDRAYVRVRGYIAEGGGAKKFYRLEGEVIGGGGGPGLRGERKSALSPWARVLDRSGGTLVRRGIFGLVTNHLREGS